MVYMHCDDKISDIITECAKDMGLHTVRGTIATGDIFVAEDSVRNKIVSLFNGVAAEMEGGAIGHVCYVNKKPFCVLRAISDCADGSGAENYMEFLGQAAENAVMVMAKFIKEY